MRKLFVLFLVSCQLSAFSCPALAQTPAPTTQKFIVTIFDITHHDLYRLITETIKNEEGVENLKPSVMQRGYIQLEGSYTGDFEPIRASAERALSKDVSMTSKAGADGVHELIFHPTGNPTIGQ